MGRPAVEHELDSRLRALSSVASRFPVLTRARALPVAATDARVRRLGEVYTKHGEELAAVM